MTKRQQAEPFISLGFAAIDWIEHFLVHGPGDIQGEAIELDDEFAGFILKAYRLTKAGRRRVRRAFLSRAKGRAKSELAAMLVCFEALGPCRFDHFAVAGEVSDWGYEYEVGEPVGRPLRHVEVLCVATTDDQAGNTYDNVRYMLHEDTCSRELKRTYGVLDVQLEQVNLPRMRGTIELVTSSANAKDGGKSTFIVADETHLWLLPRLKKLHGFMTRNLLKRKDAQGWMLETSTMYAKGENSVAESTHLYAQRVKEGKEKDGTLLFDHRQAPPEMPLGTKRQRVAALKAAYGPASAWMDLAGIADSFNDPQVSEAEWRRFWLNQPVSTTGTWLPYGVWGDRLRKHTIPDQADVVLILDGSFNGDVTGIAIYEIGEVPHLDVLAAWERPVDANADWRIPVHDVEQAIIEAALKYRVLEVTADPYRWQRSLEVLEAAGLPVAEYPQSSQRMTPATKTFYAAVLDGGMTHSGNEMLARHIDNAVLVEDSRGVRIRKETKTSKAHIDLAVCAVMGLDRAIWHHANLAVGAFNIW